MKKTKNGLIFNKFEKFIFVTTIMLLLLSPFLSVCCKSNLSKSNYNLERTKKDISVQYKQNQSLQMKIDELASLDNLENVAKEMGLSYTSDSIKILE
jgi:cell division protein FtsL